MIVGNDWATRVQQAEHTAAALETSAKNAEAAADRDFHRNGNTKETKRAFEYAAHLRERAGQARQDADRVRAEALAAFAGSM